MDFKTIIVRMVLAVILGGLVGLERETKNRPAGFRTHILVCVGSALVMVTSEYIFERYRHLANIDPARLGAQVISGIGFLGAGTIIRQGITVKGLTTAASLWAVACVGLAAGIGFYEGAIAGAAVIYLTLIVLSRIEGFVENKSAHLRIIVEVDNQPGKIGEIGILLGRYDVTIRNIEFVDRSLLDENRACIKFALKLPHGLSHDRIVKEIARISGVTSVEQE